MNTSDNTTVQPSPDNATPAYRSGVAARLAGLPVETLRVWERRYALSDTNRSAHGQRLYSADQVRRLGLLKQLVDQGHPIGSLAALPIDQLEALTATASNGAQPASGPVRVAVIGEGLGRRLAAGGRDVVQLDVAGGCARLEQAAALAAISADVLVVEVSELDEAALAPIIAARELVHATGGLVLYRFCASATIRELRAHGCLVARVPAEMGELALLCRAALEGKRLPEAKPARPAIAPRRFDDKVLALYAASGNKLQCECPRHLADLLMMVGSFERYSAHCASRTLADAELHHELEQAAGAARTILEAAMERLARAEGLEH